MAAAVVTTKRRQHNEKDGRQKNNFCNPITVCPTQLLSQLLQQPGALAPKGVADEVDVQGLHVGALALDLGAVGERLGDVAAAAAQQHRALFFVVVCLFFFGGGGSVWAATHARKHTDKARRNAKTNKKTPF